MRSKGMMMLAAAAALLGACADDGRSSRSSVATTDAATVSATTSPATAPVATVPGSVPGSSDEGALAGIRRMFAAVPDDPSFLGHVWVADYDAATAAVGATRPEPGSSDDGPAALAWDEAVFRGADSPQPRNFSSASADEWRAELGFSLMETSVAAEFRGSQMERSPHGLKLYDVSVDPAAIDAAVRSEPTWSPEMDVKEAGGTPYYFWTAGAAQDLSRQTPVRPLGRGGSMAVVDDDLVIRTLVEDHMTAALTAPADATLADRPDVTALLTSLAPHAPYEIAMSNRLAPGADASECAQGDTACESLAAQVPAPLRPPTLMAAARTIVDGERTVVLTLLHTDAAEASENATRLERNLSEGEASPENKWSDLFESWAITNDGPIVTAVLDESDQPGTQLDHIWVGLLRVEPD